MPEPMGEMEAFDRRMTELEAMPDTDSDDDGMGERWIWEPGDLDDEPAPNPTR